MNVPTYWVCVSHRFGATPENCTARGEGDSGAKAHSERSPHHPTITTTRRELADQLACPTTEDS